MRKVAKMLGALVVASVLVTGVATYSSAAGWSCAKMEATTINTSSVWLKNVSGAACGTLANGAQRYFLLDTTQRDQQLAILLTSLSLTKNVWVHSPTEVASGGTVDVIAISNASTTP